MKEDDAPIRTEKDLYDKINEYRKNLRTGALTSLDVQPFIKT